ncbi:MAG: hypothetical protein R3B55_03145 [Candidatus Paceibacterota bacterium]
MIKKGIKDLVSFFKDPDIIISVVIMALVFTGVWYAFSSEKLVEIPEKQRIEEGWVKPTTDTITHEIQIPPDK